MHEKITGELSRALAVDIPPRLDQSQLMGWGKPGNGPLCTCTGTC